MPENPTASPQQGPYHPELVLCLCAAVGTDTSVVSEALASELRAVGYKPVVIRLSALMAQIPAPL